MAKISMQLPSFEEMQAMAQQQPDALEDLRRTLTEELINNASPASRRRLRGLAFVIEGERLRARNPLQACIRLSQLMLDSTVELQATLTSLKSPGCALDNTGSARVIPFARHRSGA